MPRLHESDAAESASIIAWTERRLEHANTSGMVAVYRRQFADMWRGSFGTLDNVPADFKKRIDTLYIELKAKEALGNG